MVLRFVHDTPLAMATELGAAGIAGAGLLAVLAARAVSALPPLGATAAALYLGVSLLLNDGLGYRGALLILGLGLGRRLGTR